MKSKTTTWPNSGQKFHRDLLPDARSYYAGQLPDLKIRGDWGMACCPFHDDHRPSLAVNVLEGHFVCFSCGASGGNVLDFHMKRHAMSFVQAAMALGTWK